MRFELHTPSGYGDWLLIIEFQRFAGTKGYMAARIQVKLHFFEIILQNACSFNMPNFVFRFLS